MEAGVCQGGDDERLNDPEYVDHPVVYVSWYDAKDYCEWRGARLPTEAEWEKAARGEHGLPFPWGYEDVTGTRANFCDITCPEEGYRELSINDGYAETAPVGSYLTGVSPYGAYDMAGNVWEWVSSKYMPYPYNPEDGREDQLTRGEVMRGASWHMNMGWLWSHTRYEIDRSPTMANFDIGIRCAKSP